MSSPLEQPPRWQGTTVARFLDAPYSAEALAEPHKTWIDVGSVDFSELPHGDLPMAWGNRLKPPGENYRPEYEPVHYQGIHSMFMDTARLVLGDELYAQSNVYFDHWTSKLYPGQTFTFDEPHLDGRMPGASLPTHSTSADDRLELKMVGLLCNDAGTDIWQGPTEIGDYTGESLTHLKPGVIETRGLERAQLPVNRMVIVPPALPHAAHPADNLIEMRHFLRWQLKV